MKKINLWILILLLFLSCEKVNYECDCNRFKKERKMPVQVPDTETFNLQDVIDAVEDHAGDISDDLSACFANAVSAYFDPTYNNVSYAVANSMKRFRNYGKRTPEFVIVYLYSGTYYLASISNDGIIIDPPTFTTIEPVTPDYDSSNKLMLYAHPTSAGTVITDFTDAYNLVQKNIIRGAGTGTPGSVKIVNGNWIEYFTDTNSAIYKALTSYASFTTFNSNIFGASPPTSGAVTGIIYAYSKYYYITSTGEIGDLSSLGSSTFNELHDSATFDWRDLSYLNGILIAYDSEESSRYAVTADLTSYTTVNLNSTGSDFNVQKVEAYNSQYAVCLSGNTLYSVNHSGTPSMASITPTGYTIRDFIISGTDIYAVGDYYGTYRIVKITSLSAGAWSTYIDDIDESIYRLWLY